MNKIEDYHFEQRVTKRRQYDQWNGDPKLIPTTDHIIQSRAKNKKILKASKIILFIPLELARQIFVHPNLPKNIQNGPIRHTKLDHHGRWIEFLKNKKL